ncbi:hypothetical protein HYALB_00011183 [Hymenoscyphus albidus]|uniref:Phosphoinositide phospholipase C n=1 Tax=Hymenoscyphus albidus TaxID=595503 RepID=A0A9N9Q4M4_9HELO|nr:hypothetical protein HYALB_00011183 [Hymenoscyphus albidus]
MPPGLLVPTGKHFPIHKLMAMSTMMSPHHSAHIRPLVQAGGGDAISDVPLHQLFLSHDVQERLRRVYDAVRGKDKNLSREKFVAWLAAVQQHEINSLDEEYTFQQFLETVYYSWGFEALTKPPKLEDKDLSRPISNYYISSSHNTYLMGNQLSSKSSTEAYRNVLIRGCRCIEIDVHNGQPPEPKSPESDRSQVSSPTKLEHKQRKSTSTWSSRAAAALERASEKYKNTKKKLKSDKKKAEKEKEPGKEDSSASSSSSFSSEEEKELAKGGEVGETGRVPSGDPIKTSKSNERPTSSRSADLRSGEPLVLHGWTLTAPVGFRAVCKSIRETAFLTSNLPIIVSLEVHADMEQQELMVDIMLEEWKGLLIDEAHETCDPRERLPRLDELMNKILIKVKKGIPDKPEDAVKGSSTLSPASTYKEADLSGSDDDKSIAKRKKICEKLSNLGIYTHSEHFRSFDTFSAKSPPHVFSIGESQIMDLHSNKGLEMFQHNRDYFMRAYPAGFRIDSSNLDPSVFWRKGIQMVALNWQKLDEGMMLNEGMFAGEHGWVLKPPGYRSDPTEPIQYKTLDLNITVYAGQHIPLPSGETAKGLHPYVKCELHIEKPEDSDIKSKDRVSRAKEGDYKEKTEYSKGDHPDYGPEGQKMTFEGIPQVVEELSFVRFKVEDSKIAKDDLVAWACIRLDRLQQGYRFIHLFDVKGHVTPGMLFVKIEKKLTPESPMTALPVASRTSPAAKELPPAQVPDKVANIVVPVPAPAALPTPPADSSKVQESKSTADQVQESTSTAGQVPEEVEPSKVAAELKAAQAANQTETTASPTSNGQLDEKSTPTQPITSNAPALAVDTPPTPEPTK